MSIFSRRQSRDEIDLNQLEAKMSKHLSDAERQDEQAAKTLEIVRTNTRNNMESVLKREFRTLTGSSRRSDAVKVEFLKDSPEYYLGRLTGRLEKAEGQVTLRVSGVGDVFFPFTVDYSHPGSIVNLMTPDGLNSIFVRRLSGGSQWSPITVSPSQEKRVKALYKAIQGVSVARKLSDLNSSQAPQPDLVADNNDLSLER